MPVQGLTVTSTTSAVSLAGSGSEHGTIRVTVRNRGTGTAHLGGPTVTTAGFPLTTADNHVNLTLQPWDELYGTSTGAAVAQICDSTKQRDSEIGDTAPTATLLRAGRKLGRGWRPVARPS